MNNCDIIECLKNWLFANGIQINFLVEGTNEPACLDYGLRARFFPDFDYGSLSDHFLSMAKTEAMLHIEDGLQVYYTLFGLGEQLCDELRAANPQIGNAKSCACILGPVLFQSARKEMIDNVMENNKFPEGFRSDLVEYYNRVPMVPSHEFWNNSVFSFLKQLYGKWIFFRRVFRDTYPFPTVDHEEESDISDHEFAYQTIEERYRWEGKLCDAVAAGDSSEAIRCHSHFLKFRLSARTSDLLRNRKNMCVILNTILRKAAEQGNVHPYHIDEISRKFAMQIESSLSIDHLDVLAKTMVQGYCEMVREYSRKGLSPAVRNTVNYIDFNYASELTLEKLSGLFAVSPCHLSRTFSKEMGLGISDYINKTRIKASTILLSSNLLSITQIAAQCGFSSPTYFTRIFRRQMGMTPMEYRTQFTQGAKQ